MVNQVISDTLETLGQQAGQVGQQVAQEPGKMKEQLANQVLPPLNQPEQPKGPTPEERAANERMRRRRLADLKEEGEAIRRKQVQEIPAYISGKPGFSQEGDQKQEGGKIKQLGTLKPGEKPKDESQLPPPVATAKKGGAERKIKGASG